MQLSVKGLSFAYDKLKNILEGISFDYDSSEMLCILGENGTGKSTLLKCICSQNKSYKGKIEVNGKDIKEMSPCEFALNIAYLPQTQDTTFGFRVIDVVMMGRTSHIGKFSSPGADDYKLAMEKLDFLGIGKLENCIFTEISGGERQLVMIAATLAQQSQIIIMDEPTSHLDFGNQYRFLTLVEKLQEQNIGVIMTTHFPNHALDLKCRTIILKDSKLIADGRAEELITEEKMQYLYEIPIHIISDGHKKICIPGDVNDG